MTDAQRQAAEKLYRALRNRACSCVHNVPYDSGNVKQEITQRCFRCEALAAWEAVRGETTP